MARPLVGQVGDATAPPGETEDFELVLSVLVENAPVAMAMFDGQMRYVLANRQWINDFGLQNFLPLVGRCQFDVFPDLHPGWRSVYARAMQGHIVRSENDVMPGPHGKPMIFRWEVRPWRRSKDNAVGGVMVTCEKFAAPAQPGEAEPLVVPVAPPPVEEPASSAVMDAALQKEKRQLEDQLADTAEKLRMLQDTERAYRCRELRQREVLDAMPCGLIVLDERGRPTFHNNHVRALFGRELKVGDTVEDWLMQACLDDHHREEVAIVWRESVWRRQLSKIVSLSTADGLVKDLEFRPTALGHGCLLLTIHDVTDTCRLEEMLRSTEAKFRVMLNGSPVAAVLTDVTGSIFEANAAAEKLLGHPKAELRRMGIDEWLAPESALGRRVEIQRMTAGRLAHGVLQGEVASGRQRPFHPMQIRLAAVYDAEGRLHSLIHFLQPNFPALVETVARSVHASPPLPELEIPKAEKPQLPPEVVQERKQRLGPLLSVTRHWPEANLEREQLLLTEAHHRIKNHLQIISSLLNLQSNALEDASARQALCSSQTRVRAIASLHEHLYQLSQGKEIGLQEFTNELVVRLRDCYDIPVERVAVTMHLQQCEMRDEWRVPLALILNEAVSNAFKHAFADGRSGAIDIKLTVMDLEAHLTIRDNGMGLPANLVGSSGPGLGLKVVGVFAEQMRGNASMENMANQGTCFILRFPVEYNDN